MVFRVFLGMVENVDCIHKGLLLLHSMYFSFSALPIKGYMFDAIWIIFKNDNFRAVKQIKSKT